MRQGMVVALVALAAVGVWLLARDGAPARHADRATPAEDSATSKGPVLLPGVPVSTLQEAPSRTWPTGHGSIEVVLLDVRGKPVSGVAVTLQHNSQTNQWRQLGRLMRADQRVSPVTIASQASGENGRVRFVGLDASERYQVRAMPRAPWVARQRTLAPRAIWLRPAELVLAEGTPLRVRLVDTAGRGLAGSVQLRLDIADGEGLGRGWRSPRFTSDASGHLYIAALPAGSLSLMATALDYGRRSGVPVRIPTDDTLVVAVGEPDGGTVFGTVTTTDGTPIKDAAVLIEIKRYRQEQMLRMAKTATDGTYRLDGLVPGPVQRIVCEATGFGPSPRRQDLQIDAGTTQRVDIQLQRGTEIRGSVRGPEGEAIANASVDAHVVTDYRSGHASQTVTTGADGRFVLAALPAGSATLWPAADGYLAQAEGEQSLVLRGRLGYGLMVGDTSPVSVELTMTKSVPHGGRVVDAAQQPVAGVQLRVHAPRAQVPNGLKQTTVSDEQGRFVFRQLPDAASFQVTARAGEFAIPAVDLLPGLDNLVQLPAAGRLRGRVVFADGRSHQRVAVRATSDDNANAVAYVAFDGSFAFAGLLPGTWTLVVQDGLRRAVGDPVVVSVRANKDTPPVEIRLPAFLRITGSLARTDGTPYAGVEIIAKPQAGAGRARVITGPDGRFQFSLVRAGSYVISSAFVRGTVIAQAGDSQVQLVAAAPVVVSGTVRLEDGSTPASATFSAVIPGAESKLVTARNGVLRCEIAGPEATTVRFVLKRLRDADGQRLSAQTFVHDVDVRAGKASVALVLKLGRNARVTFVDPGGAPVSGTMVSVFSGPHASHSPNFGLRSNADGVVELTGLPHAQVHVNIQPPPQYARPTKVTLGVERSTLRVTLAYGGSIAGRVLGPKGASVPNSGVMFRSESGQGMAQVGTDGRFEIDGLPLGARGVVTASVWGHPPKYAAIKQTDVSVGTRDLEFRFAPAAFISGRVVDPLGVPVGRIQLYASFRSGAGGRMIGGRSAADGTFVIGPLEKGVEYSVSSGRAKGWLNAVSVRVTAPATDVQLVLQDGNRITGTLVGDNVDGVTVSWSRVVPGIGVQTERATTDADGGFVLRTNGTQSGVLLVQDRKGGRYARIDDVSAPRSGVRLVLEPALTISGTIEGLPGDATGVSVMAKDGTVSAGVPVRSGNAFVIPCVPPGTYELTLTVHSPRHTVTLASIEAGATGVVITLK